MTKSGCSTVMLAASAFRLESAEIIAVLASGPWPKTTQRFASYVNMLHVARAAQSLSLCLGSCNIQCVSLSPQVEVRQKIVTPLWSGWGSMVHICLSWRPSRRCSRIPYPLSQQIQEHHLDYKLITPCGRLYR
ncbi:hypothetical protein BDW22DRAFT_1266599 [Trametopsis cervina]|nr:hypothetical protein BDW22DRAFT_1266599 [Trametopsis cervina]